MSTRGAAAEVRQLLSSPSEPSEAFTWGTLVSESGSVQGVDHVFVNVWGRSLESRDELVPLTETVDFLETLRRGAWFIDVAESADSNRGQLAHDMDGLSTDRLLGLLTDPVSDLTLSFL